MIPILVRVPPEDVKALDERAHAVGRTRAETLRRMIKWALSQPLPKEHDRV